MLNECVSNVFTTLKYPKKTVGLYTEVDKTSIRVQSSEQEVKKLHVEQEHHLQEFTLHRQLKTIAIFTIYFEKYFGEPNSTWLS